MDEIEAALQPPRSARIDGRPVWYGDDDDAWTEWEVVARRPRIGGSVG